MKKKKPIDLSKVKPEDMVKYEIAKELGLFEKVMQEGWGALSAKETGRIGGMVTKRKKLSIGIDGTDGSDGTNEQK